MRATSLLLPLLLLCGAPAIASADSSSAGFGVGVESMITGLTGPTVTFQTPQFHAEGLLSYVDSGQTTLGLAGLLGAGRRRRSADR